MARNAHFQFKQFRIEQDRTAMKVCTDACVLGAWADVNTSKRILDIGTGTGLLALMVAQRNPNAWIDALELDRSAAEQAHENVAKSLFADRILVHTGAVQTFNADEKYDTIITNPPFFQFDLLSPNASINQAHHAQTLTFADLIRAINRLIHNDGQWYVLLPVEESETLQTAAQTSGWYPREQLLLTHQPGRRPFRRLTAYSQSQESSVTNQAKELFIYEKDGKTYTSEFRTLLKEYYLVF